MQPAPVMVGLAAGELTIGAGYVSVKLTPVNGTLFTFCSVMVMVTLVALVVAFLIKMRMHGRFVFVNGIHKPGWFALLAPW